MFDRNQDSLTSALINEFIKEKRSEKRWKNFRFFFVWLMVIIIIVLLASSSFISVGGPEKDKNYVAFIKLEGMIESGREFSASEVLPRLRDAFSDSQAKGVVIDINSPGGTPVQSSIIYNAIMNLKKQYHKKVIVIGEDILASGAYFVAVAADKIYVNPNTITGSIGVAMKGFGFPELIKKWGIERRVLTAGVNKDRLDPFLPENKEDLEKVRQVMSEVHGNFNQAVLTGRKGKLRRDPKELFTGDFWTGQTALKLGLVDGLGDITDVLQSEFNVSRYKDYSGGEGLKSVLNQFGMAMNIMLGNESFQVLEKI